MKWLSLILLTPLLFLNAACEEHHVSELKQIGAVEEHPASPDKTEHAEKP